MVDSVTAAGSILIVDDDEQLAAILTRRLRRQGHQVKTASTCREARARLSSWVPDCIVLDLRLPDGRGLDLLDGIEGLQPLPKVVVTTGFPSLASCVEALHRGAVDYLPKPVSAAQVLEAFRSEPQGTELPREEVLHSLDRMEWEYIHYVLKRCNWSISQAARMLGITRWSLQRKLKKYPSRE